MSKRSFEIFAEVCDRQSMSEAAKALDLSQPAVSAAIASLEKEYETKLFIRRGKTLQLSEPGRRLRQYADIILDQYSRAWDDLHEQPQAERFVIGVSDNASEIFLPANSFDVAAISSNSGWPSRMRTASMPAKPGAPTTPTFMLMRLRPNLVYRKDLS